MHDPGILLKQHFYPYKELLHYSGTEPVLRFCAEWLNGREQFPIHTSGSTGKPKQLYHTAHQMRNSAEMTNTLLKAQPSDRWLLALDPGTVGGRMVLVRAMEWKLSAEAVMPSSDPFRELDPRHTCTLVSLVPYQLENILECTNSLNKLNRFRIILLGGSLVSEELEQKLEKVRPLILHTYGMTETCSHVAVRHLNGPNPQEAFYPLPGVSVGLMENGCLWINTPSAESNPVRTTDIAELEPNGGFRLLGREDFAVNSGGVKILPEEMERLWEAEIHRHFPGCRYFACGLPDPKLGQKLVLFIEGTPPEENSNLLAVLKAQSPRYKAPKEIIFAPRFSETASGKIDRNRSIFSWGKTN